MNQRISDKIEEIQKYLGELSQIRPTDIETYVYDFKTKAACERYAERIIEAMIDLAILVIKDRKFSMPENDSEAFDILCRNRILTSALGDKLKDAKGMRNILAHQYGEVDDAIVFRALSEELDNDIREFIKAVIANSD
jgi:uncharacterized protein YutE (UPF0331/DUF86 family)